MSSVVALSRTVNKISEIPSEVAIKIGRRLSRLSPLIEPPIITGSSGKTQGAKTVKIPAMKAPISKNIYYCAVGVAVVLALS